jgi:sec-independent protein translocase protein TatA
VPGIGIPELIIVLVILLVIFGPKRLPSVGRSLGSGMKEFKDSISGKSDDDADADADRPALGAGAGSVSADAETSRASDQSASAQVPTEPRA